MGHCISVYLINKRELRDSKIDSVLNDLGSYGTWIELKEGILAIRHIKNIREFGKGRIIAKIETDYFGGAGSQSAKLFIDNKKVYDKNSEFDYSCNPINDVLEKMGVVCRDNMDEFDTIELGNYRSNQDFE
jgi:hypothetical protein